MLSLNKRFFIQENITPFVKFHVPLFDLVSMWVFYFPFFSLFRIGFTSFFRFPFTCIFLYFPMIQIKGTRPYLSGFTVYSMANSLHNSITGDNERLSICGNRGIPIISYNLTLIINRRLFVCCRFV